MRELSYLILVVALLMGSIWAGVREGKDLEWKNTEVWLKTDVLPKMSNDKYSVRNYTLEKTEKGQFVRGRIKPELLQTTEAEQPDPFYSMSVTAGIESGCTEAVKAAF